MTSVLIIGAGASGLMAGRLLSEQDYDLTFLEARDRIGGRIDTIHDKNFAQAIDLGAEFVHGTLPVTLDLLNEAGIAFHQVDGEVWYGAKGHFSQRDDLTEYWPLLNEKLLQLEHDCSIRTLLDNEFSGDRYAAMRTATIAFVKGYEGADPDDVSAFSLREERPDEDDDEYRIDGGYGKLTDYLFNQCKQGNAAFHFSEVVSEIHWRHDGVIALTQSGARYEADLLIVTVPLALLQEDAIRFSPPIPEYLQAAKQIGVGHAMKFLLQFEDHFWRSLPVSQLDKLQVLLCDLDIPTWWTQYPESDPLLAGWVGGPDAVAMQSLSADVRLEKALDTLSHMLDCPTALLAQHVTGWKISDWSTDPFARGAFSYERIGSSAAKAFLGQAVQDTIYFAGEALYSGSATGTVEAALSSGKDVARKIIQHVA